MPNPIIRIHDLTTDIIEDREMTNAEYNKYKLNQEKLAVEQTEAEAKETAKSALLKKLGITAEEAALLLS